MLHWPAEPIFTYDDGIIGEEERDRQYKVIEATLKDPARAHLVDFRPAKPARGSRAAKTPRTTCKRPAQTSPSHDNVDYENDPYCNGQESTAMHKSIASLSLYGSASGLCVKR